jgi:hypothetical protein
VTFNFLEWLSQPKTARTRRVGSFGCFGALIFGAPLCVLVLAFSAIPHCQTCADNTGRDLLHAVGFASLFGVASGVTAVSLQSILERYCSDRVAIGGLVLAIATAAYFGLSPALALIT